MVMGGSVDKSEERDSQTMYQVDGDAVLVEPVVDLPDHRHC